MGLFSSLWKGVKNVFKGILKVFQPILEPIAKFLDSDLGKAIMIGLSVFTLGTAMVAGYGAFSSSMAAGNGFISSFVEGGKVFLSTLTGVGGKEGAGAAADAGAEVAAQTAGQASSASTNVNLLTGGSPEVAGASAQTALEAGQAGSMAMGPGATGDVMQRAVQAGGSQTGAGAMLPEAAATTGAGQASTGVAPALTGKEAASTAVQAAGKEGGWLSRAAKSAGEFIKSEGGGQIVGSLIQGAGNYYTEKDRQEFEDRIRRDWRKGTGDAGIRGIRESSARVGDLPGIQAYGRAGARQPEGEQRRPSFERQYGAAAPAGG